MPQEMSGSAFFYWAERNVPHENRKFYHVDDIKSWIADAEVRITRAVFPSLGLIVIYSCRRAGGPVDQIPMELTFPPLPWVGAVTHNGALVMGVLNWVFSG